MIKAAHISVHLRWMWIAVILLGMAQPARAEGIEPTIRFRNLDLAQKASPSRRKGVVQDQLGFVWIPLTYGLARYDGHHYKVFTKEKYPEMISDQVRLVYADSKNRIWVSYIGGGVQYYSMEDQRFYDFQKEEFAACRATVFYEDQKGYIWIDGFDHKLCRIEPSAAQGMETFQLPGNTGTVYSMVEDVDGQIWMGTSRGLFKYTEQTKQITFPDQRLSFPVSDLEIMSGDKLWMIADKKGIVSYQENGKQLQLYVNNQDPEWFGSDITCLSIDQQDHLWIGTENGLFCYKPKTDDWEKYSYDRADRFGLRDNYVMTSMVTRSGSIWLETSRGICIMDQTLSKFRHYHCRPPKNKFVYDHTNVFGLYVGKDGKVWSGSIGGGLLSYDPATDTYRQFRMENGNPNSLPSNVITEIWSSGDDFIWIRTRGGIARMDLRTEKIQKMDLKIDGRRVYFSAIGQDANGYIWLGTHLHGAVRYDMKTETYQHFPFKIDFSEFYLDDDGNFFCAADDGVYLFDPKSDDFVALKSNDSKTIQKVTIMVRSKDGNYWVGTERGLIQCKIDTQKHTIKCITKDLPTPLDKIVYCMVQDRRGHLWITSDVGLMRYVPTTRSVIIYGVYDGLDEEAFNMNAQFVDEKGNIYFGGVDGVYSFHPQTISENQVAPEVYITDLEVVDNSVRPGDEWGILQKDLLFTNMVSIPYRLNKIKFNVVGVNFTSPHEVQYKYRLSGFDTKWSETTLTNHVTYTNLSPGVYTFQVVASNEDGLWSDSPRSITLEILPEYYQTWWFIMLIILGALGVILIVFRWWTQIINKRHQLHKDLIRSRQRALCAQMNPHFLFNCLNSIRHFMLTNQRRESNAFLVKFSQLIRRVFDSSSNSQVTVEEELETLRLYLELEQLRTGKNFEFEILVHDEVDAKQHKIPPLIIQPFVENAIWHGISGVEKGYIKVEFSRRGKNVLCTIDDNGIGREAAIAIRDEKKPDHKSGALQITRQRLELITELTRQMAGYTIVDRKDHTGHTSGTRVEIIF